MSGSDGVPVRISRKYRRQWEGASSALEQRRSAPPLPLSTFTYDFAIEAAVLAECNARQERVQREEERACRLAEETRLKELEEAEEQLQRVRDAQVRAVEDSIEALSGPAVANSASDPAAATGEGTVASPPLPGALPQSSGREQQDGLFVDTTSPDAEHPAPPRMPISSLVLVPEVLSTSTGDLDSPTRRTIALVESMSKAPTARGEATPPLSPLPSFSPMPADDGPFPSAGAALDDDRQRHLLGHTPSRRPLSASEISLSDFEPLNHNSTPFETMTLASMNDAQELHSLLGGLSLDAGESAGTASSVGGDTGSSVSSEGTPTAALSADGPSTPPLAPDVRPSPTPADAPARKDATVRHDAPRLPSLTKDDQWQPPAATTASSSSSSVPSANEASTIGSDAVSGRPEMIAPLTPTQRATHPPQGSMSAVVSTATPTSQNGVYQSQNRADVGDGTPTDMDHALNNLELAEEISPYVQMGFPEPVARAAVEKYGAAASDDIMALLLRASNLCEAGYPAESVAAALCAYEDEAKVKEFLDAAVQLAGMGFEARRVHDALLAAANDAAEAVDILSR